MRATETLADGRVVESPAIVGMASMESLARLLDGEPTTLVFSPPGALPMPPDLTPSSSGEFITIPINDAPLDETRYVSRVLVTRWPIHGEMFAGAVLERNDGRWHAYAGAGVEWEVKDVPAFLVREPWACLLGRSISDELAAYVRLADTFERVTDQWIGREVQSRCNYYNRRDLDGFFADTESSLLWEIGTGWPDWQDRALNSDACYKDLVARCPELVVTHKQFMEICAREGLSFEWKPKERNRQKIERKPPVSRPELFSLLRASPASTQRLLSEFKDDDQLKTIFVGGEYPEVDETSPLSAQEFELVRDWDPDEDAIFSQGGAPDFSFDLDASMPSEFPNSERHKTLQSLVERVWWWKAIAHDFIGGSMIFAEEPSDRENLRTTKLQSWPPALSDLFRDNWERGAFFYEFRARFGGRNGWDLFGQPWVKLNHTERGILTAYWPPTHVGRTRIQPKLSPAVLRRLKREIQIKLQHDLNSPPAILRDKAFAELQEHARRLGFHIPGKGEGARRTLPWRALEFLDVERCLGIRFADNESKLSRTTKAYIEACFECGLTP